MMKSFFKKLAFVMALAMVVSMVAPAGSAFAAETGVSLQGTKTIVETYELEKAGATVDFSFQGAPKDWKTTFAWTSSNEAVATVNKAGVVTAVAAGTATITITAGADASYAETVVVTVKDEKNFTVTQTTVDTFVVTFDSEQTYTYDDFTVTEIFDTVTVDAPIKASEFTAGTGTTVTLKLTAAVDDLVPYEISFKGKTETIIASAGEVDSVKFGFYTAADNCDRVYGTAYVETEDENNTVYLYPVFCDANGVDVSAIVDADDFSIDYEAVQESEKFTIGYDELTFEAPYAATVKMTTEWFDEEGEEYHSEYVDVIVATKRAPLKVTFMDGGVFFTDATDADTCGSWANGGNGDYTNDFTTQPWGYAWSAGKAAKEIVLGDESVPVYVARLSDNRQPSATSTTVTYTTRGEISYASSNENIFEIDSATGEITAKKVGAASVLVYFLETDEENPVLVGSTKITVKAERYPASVTASATQVKIANAGLDTAGEVKLTVKDQYGSKIDLANGDADITVEAASSKNTTVLSADRTGTGEYKIRFNASQFDAFTSSSASHSYNVTFDKTENKKLDKSKLSFSVRIYNVTDDYAQVTAADNKEFKYAVNFEDSFDGNTVDVRVNKNNFNFGWAGSNAADVVKEQNLAVYYVNKNGFRLDEVASMEAYVRNQKTGEAGVVYYTITEPTIKRVGDDNNAEWAVADNKVTWTFNTQDGSTFSDYAKEGTYKVTLYVTKSETNDDLKKLGDYSINVVNSAPVVSFSGYTNAYAKDNNSHYWNFDAIDTIVEGMSQTYAAGNDAAVISAIYDCLGFWYTPEVENWYYNQAACAGLQANITGYTAKKISNTKMAIKDVTFEITLPGTSETITRTVRVNSSISK